MCRREEDNILDILMIVSEALPSSKISGLGDVGVALPGALGLPSNTLRPEIKKRPGDPFPGASVVQ